jgi:hypothetical protein
LNVAIILIVFLLGWATQGLTLFDVGRYSFPLILFASIPFCLRWKNNQAGFLVLPIASSIFAFLVAIIEDVQFSHIFSQTVLQALAILFAGGAASMDWRKHLKTLTSVTVGVGVPIVAYAGYQMIARAAHLPFAFLPITNKQYYIDGGLQRDWDKDGITRASSVFSEPSELGFFCLWLLALGLAQKSGKLRNIALAFGIAGILFSQSLSAVLGAFVLLLVFLFSNPFNKQILKQLGFGILAAAAAVALMKPLVPDAFDHLSERVVQAVHLDDRADSGRVDHLPAIWRVITDSPIYGHGLSSLAVASSSGGNDTTTINYAMLLMERGVLGATLFFIPWFSFAARAWLMPIDTPGRSVALLLMVATLYSYCSFSLTYFLPFWLALGIAASVVNSYRAELSESIAENSWEPAGQTITGMG